MAKLLPSLQRTLQYAWPFALPVVVTPIGKGDSPTQPLIPFVSICACCSGDMARRLSLAELPDPPAAIAVRPQPAAITAASSNIPLRIAHLAALILAESIAAAELPQRFPTRSRDHRKDDVRRVRRVGKDLVSGDARAVHRTFALSRIRVDVKMREVAARNVEAQPVARDEKITRREELDRDRVGFTRHHWRGSLPAIAISDAQNPLGQVHRKTLRVILVRRIDIDQLGGEVGVWAIGRDPQPDRHRARYLQVTVEPRSGEDEHVGAFGERPIGLARTEHVGSGTLVVGPGAHHRLARAQRPANTRRRVAGVEDVSERSSTLR